MSQETAKQKLARENAEAAAKLKEQVDTTGEGKVTTPEPTPEPQPEPTPEPAAKSMGITTPEKKAEAEAATEGKGEAMVYTSKNGWKTAFTLSVIFDKSTLTFKNKKGQDMTITFFAAKARIVFGDGSTKMATYRIQNGLDGALMVELTYGKDGAEVIEFHQKK